MAKMLILTFALLQFSVTSFADDQCLDVAIRKVKEQTTRTSIVSQIQNLPVDRPYLEAYRITLTSAFAPPKAETFRIILMKSDCSTASLIRELGI
jgi:hypothetical protein